MPGTGEVKVWVTPEVASEFVPRERLKESPEVHVAATCVRQNGKSLLVLVAERSPDRQFFPGLLEGCGGQLAKSETFTQGVERHYRTELGIEVKVLPDVHCFYEIREPNAPLIPGIRFLCEPAGSVEVSPSPRFSEARWVSEADFRDTPASQFIEGLKDQVLQLIEEDRGRQPATLARRRAR